jgi:hypothetical protein
VLLLCITDPMERSLLDLPPKLDARLWLGDAWAELLLGREDEAG